MIFLLLCNHVKIGGYAMDLNSIDPENSLNFPLIPFCRNSQATCEQITKKAVNGIVKYRRHSAFFLPRKNANLFSLSILHIMQAVLL